MKQDQASLIALVPQQNRQGHALLYLIEVGLREFTIDAIESAGGSAAWKHRLPGDVLKMFRDAISYERSVKWTRLIPHHPIYYVDFPDLKKIIARADNWRDLFKDCFVRQDLLISTLSELEPIRNRVAHNRKLSKRDLDIVEAGFVKLASAIGASRLRMLVRRCTTADDLPATLSALLDECEATFSLCTSCGPVNATPIWDRVKVSWWFDSDYLGLDLDAVEGYFRAIDQYREVPRSRGTGHQIEAWVKVNGLTEKYEGASKQLRVLVSEVYE